MLLKGDKYQLSNSYPISVSGRLFLSKHAVQVPMEMLHFATECRITSGSTLFTALQSRKGESATCDLQQTTLINWHFSFLKINNVAPPCSTERLLMGRKESNQTNKTMWRIKKKRKKQELQCGYRECSGSVVKCLTRGQGVASSSLTRGTAVCTWARHMNSC